MKKKLEAELISIAHRILKLKNKSDVVQLHSEAQKLYEKLSVLRFVEENFGDAKPTVGRAEVEDKMEAGFDYHQEQIPEPEMKEEPQPENDKPAADTGHDETEGTILETVVPEIEAEVPTPMETPEEKDVDELIAEAEEEMASAPESEQPAEENIESEAEIPEDESADGRQSNEPQKEDPIFTPVFEWTFDNKAEAEESEKEETVSETEAQTEKSFEAEKPTAEDTKPEEVKETQPTGGQVAFDDLLGSGYKDPVFVKPEELERERTAWTPPDTSKHEVISISRRDDKIPVFKMNNSDIGDKTISLNDRLSKGITVGLNDRIAFVKNLFNNSNEDYNRVLSQLITFDTFAEAQEFIDQMVKPDYNNWVGKDEYAQRFMEVVEKKFT